MSEYREDLAAELTSLRAQIADRKGRLRALERAAMSGEPLRDAETDAQELESLRRGLIELRKRHDELAVWVEGPLAQPTRRGLFGELLDWGVTYRGWLAGAAAMGLVVFLLAAVYNSYSSAGSPPWAIQYKGPAMSQNSPARPEYFDEVDDMEQLRRYTRTVRAQLEMRRELRAFMREAGIDPDTGAPLDSEWGEPIEPFAP